MSDYASLIRPPHLLGRIVAGQEFEDMAIRVSEINPAPTVPVVELHVVESPRLAAIDQAGIHDTPKDLVELGLAHFEGVVCGLKRLAVVEVQR